MKIKKRKARIKEIRIGISVYFKPQIQMSFLGIFKFWQTIQVFKDDGYFAFCPEYICPTVKNAMETFSDWKCVFGDTIEIQREVYVKKAVSQKNK